MPKTHQIGTRPWYLSRTGIAFGVFVAIAAFFLITEHTAHLFGILPYALLLLFLLVHLFMHGSHSGHGASQSSDTGTHSPVSGTPPDQSDRRRDPPPQATLPHIGLPHH